MTTIPQAGILASNPMVPEPAVILDVIVETANIKSYRVAFEDTSIMENFSFLPGQIALVSVPGTGESTFAISSPPSQKEYLQFSIMRTGAVTGAIHDLIAGDSLTVRAPMGCAFPTDDWQGRNIVIVAGGIGMAPLRSLLLHLLDHKDNYGEIKLIYGARTPADLCFVEDLNEWEKDNRLEVIATVDTAESGWTGREGLVPHVLEAEGLSPHNTIAITCGPPVMIKYTLLSLDKMGFREEQTFTTLERRMKCGIGLCGRCNVGSKYVCTDGPVFSLEQLKELPDEL